MSIAAETDMYIFPDDVPVNIANPEDLGRLRSLFEGRDLYIAVGSDVVRNASSYKAGPQKNSIHTFNHIVFAREARQTDRGEDEAYPVRGKVINLRLGKFYEDISSTRIRENITDENYRYMVADNSTSRAKRKLIQEVCQKYGIDYAFLSHPSITREMIVEDIEKRLGKNANLDKVQSDQQLTGRGYDVSTSGSPVSYAGVIYEWNRGVIAVDSEGREEKENLDKKFFSHHVDATIRASRRLGSIIGETETDHVRFIGKGHNGICHKGNKGLPGDSRFRTGHFAFSQVLDFAAFFAEIRQCATVIGAPGIDYNRLSAHRHIAGTFEVSRDHRHIYRMTLQPRFHICQHLCAARNRVDGFRCQ